MKIRLVKGPFGGKVMESPEGGRNVIVLSGPKKMTRKQQHEHFVSNHNSYAPFGHRPMVEARYEIAIRPHGSGDGCFMAACQHPDGSIFYEYVEGSRRER